MSALHAFETVACPDDGIQRRPPHPRQALPAGQRGRRPAQRHQRSRPCGRIRRGHPWRCHAGCGRPEEAGANGLVVAGDNDVATQCIVNAINVALGAVGTTVKYNEKAALHQGDDAPLTTLVEDMKAGRVSALVRGRHQPAYHAANAAAFNTGLDKVAFSVSTAGFADESAARCTGHCPEPPLVGKRGTTCRSIPSASTSPSRPSSRCTTRATPPRACSPGRASPWMPTRSCAGRTMRPTVPRPCTPTVLEPVSTMASSHVGHSGKGAPATADVSASPPLWLR